MINGTQGLSIKPLSTYSNIGNKYTTITGFDKVLEDTRNKISNSEEDSEKDEDKVTETEDDKSIVYKDPVTGEDVKYVDVSDEEDDDNDKKVSSNNNTTTASSMKKTKYDAYFKEAARKYNVSESLLKAIAKAESDFNANCVSSAGAIGVMQLMPSTADSLGVKDPYDPRQNILGGAKCIAQKLKEFNGDVRLALAAYNAGSGAVKRNGGVPSYCKVYVNKVLSYKEAFETANAVG